MLIGAFLFFHYSVGNACFVNLFYDVGEVETVKTVRLAWWFHIAHGFKPWAMCMTSVK
jgi:hypothetical protein